MRLPSLRVFVAPAATAPRLIGPRRRCQAMATLEAQQAADRQRPPLAHRHHTSLRQLELRWRLAQPRALTVRQFLDFEFGQALSKHGPTGLRDFWLAVIIEPQEAATVRTRESSSRLAVEQTAKRRCGAFSLWDAFQQGVQEIAGAEHAINAPVWHRVPRLLYGNPRATNSQERYASKSSITCACSTPVRR